MIISHCTDFGIITIIAFIPSIAIAITGINTNLKKIALKLGWKEEPSTYFARHAYSTNLINCEVPLAFISKQLDHKDLKTTQNYLGSFSTNKATEYYTNLLDGNKIA